MKLWKDRRDSPLFIRQKSLKAPTDPRLSEGALIQLGSNKFVEI